MIYFQKNYILISCKLLIKMKNADVSPVFKKDDHLNKSNYGPVSILQSDSKIFGKLLLSQINNYIEPLPVHISMRFS